MLWKQLEVPLAVVRNFVRDMRAVHAATGFERNETGRRLHALRKHLELRDKLRLTESRTVPRNESSRMTADVFDIFWRWAKKDGGAQRSRSIPG
jgi:hypothetical protein